MYICVVENRIEWHKDHLKLVTDRDTLHHVDKLVVINDPIVVFVAIAHQLVNFPVLKVISRNKAFKETFFTENN